MKELEQMLSEQDSTKLEVCQYTYAMQYVIESIMIQIVDIPGKGKGVVAKADYKKNEFICEYVGELLPYEKAVQREERYIAEHPGTYKSYMFFFNFKGKRFWLVKQTGLS